MTATLFAILISVVGALGCWVFLFPYQSPKDLQLSLPTEPVVIRLCVDCTQTQLQPLGPIIESPCHLEMEVLARPDPGESQVLFNCALESFSILGEDGEALFSFRKSGPYQHHYHFAPRLSEEERSSFCELFHINWQEASALNDQSLFTHQWSLAFNRRGGLYHVRLPREWADALSSLWTAPMDELWKNISSGSFRFPNLLAHAGNDWLTYGFMGHPMTLKHVITERNGYAVNIHSSGQFSQVPRDVQNMNIQWTFDRKAGTIEGFDIHYTQRNEVHKHGSPVVEELQLRAKIQGISHHPWISAVES